MTKQSSEHLLVGLGYRVVCRTVYAEWQTHYGLHRYGVQCVLYWSSIFMRRRSHVCLSAVQHFFVRALMNIFANSSVSLVFFFGVTCRVLLQSHFRVSKQVLQKNFALLQFDWQDDGVSTLKILFSILLLILHDIVCLVATQCMNCVAQCTMLSNWSSFLLVF